MDKRVVIGLIVLGIVILFSLMLTFFFAPMMSEGGFGLGGANVAHIRVLGPITSEDDGSLFGGGGGATSASIIEQIDAASKDWSIEAIVIEINSPGGTVLPSKEIARAVKDAPVPTVAWIRDIGASGGYWIASAADHVIADELSITGSIGVIATSLGFEGVLDRYNVTYRRLIAGEYKDAGTPFREMTPQEMGLFQQRLDIIHDAFIDAIVENRNMSRKKVHKVANGMFYLGSQAYELGLVDELGGEEEVKEHLKKILEVDAIVFEEFYAEPSLIDMILGAVSTFSFQLGNGIGNGLQNGITIRT